MLTTLQEQGGGMFSEAKLVSRQLLEHVATLLGLLKIEMGEYARHQRAKWVLVAAAAFFLTVAYLAVNVLSCFVMYEFVASWVWSIGAVCVFNLLIGLILLLAAVSRKTPPAAELTRQELQKDLECLRILLSDEKSSTK